MFGAIVLEPRAFGASTGECWSLARLRGARQGWPLPPHPRPGTSLGKQLPCAGGGRGWPRPLHSRPGASPLGTPIRCMHMPSVWCTCLRAHSIWQLMIEVLIWERHDCGQV